MSRLPTRPADGLPAPSARAPRRRGETPRSEGRPRSPFPIALLRLVLVAAGLLAPAAVRAQEPAPTPDIVVGAEVDEVPSPGGAFLRSLAVPGWGHAAIGSYTRGAFYVAAETGTAYALIRTRLRLGEARERVELRERVLRTALQAEGVTDPAVIEERLDTDPALVDARGLVSAREAQQEDWVAFGIFLVLLSAADAYVSAHLADFPDPLDLGAAATGDGGVELTVRVSVRGP